MNSVDYSLIGSYSKLLYAYVGVFCLSGERTKSKFLISQQLKKTRSLWGYGGMGEMPQILLTYIFNTLQTVGLGNILILIDGVQNNDDALKASSANQIECVEYLSWYEQKARAILGC
ncbi:hypothetical protein HQ34_00390 [Porphyromonas cangingivalis]|nr:hypothetical protein HQ34_00390 [Porphyromonas cangingivalis]